MARDLEVVRDPAAGGAADPAALEKELQEFSGGLPYDQARVIERTQDGFRQGVHGFYQAALGLILLHQHEGPHTYAVILEQYFPGISRSAAEKYMRFARAASVLPTFKQFCLERGGYSKGLTMLQSCTEEQMEEFDETGEVLGFTQDQIDNMSVVSLKKALRRAREREAQAIKKATEKMGQENVKLKEQVAEMEAALSPPEVQAALKLIDGAGRHLANALKLLRKIPLELMAQDGFLRQASYAVLSQIRGDAELLETEIGALAGDPGEMVRGYMGKLRARAEKGAPGEGA